MTRARSSSSASSCPVSRAARRGPSRASASSCRTVPTRHGTHCPHDSSRKNAAIRRSVAGQVGGVSNGEHHAGAERGPDLAGALEGERHVELVGQHEAARRAAEQDRPQRRRARRPPARAARAGWRRTCTSYTPGVATAPETQNSFGAGGPAAADLGERRAADREDLQHVEERLHVVDHRRLAEQAADAAGTAACCAARRASPRSS